MDAGRLNKRIKILRLLKPQMDLEVSQVPKPLCIPFGAHTRKIQAK
jgi:hypothetical protein